MELRNKKWTEQEFLEERKKVLATWKTGADPLLDLDTAVAYLKSLPEHKNFAIKLEKAKNEKSRTLVQPRAGVPLINDQVTLLTYLQNAGADFVPSTIDSYTRQNRYLEAEKGIDVKNWGVVFHNAPKKGYVMPERPCGRPSCPCGA